MEDSSCSSTRLSQPNGLMPYLRLALGIACGLKKPTVAAAKLYLARNLTEEQDRALDLFSQQRLLRAYRRKRLEDLPHRREVEKDILFALEEQMMSTIPF